MAIERSVSPVPLVPQPEYPYGLEVELAPEDASAVSQRQEDGSVIVDFAPEDGEVTGPIGLPHAANLAEFLASTPQGKTKLGVIASELIRSFNSDKQSRREWEETYKKGIKLLGLGFEDRTEPFEGASGVYHPLLAEAVVRFQSHTILDTFPASGPVKGQVVGKQTEERMEQAQRVQQDLNFQVTEVMSEFRAETETMLFNLPLAGSAFKKVYFDPNLNRAVSMFVPADDLVVPYGTSDYKTAPRMTHALRRHKNQIRRLQVSGFYRDVDVPDPVPDFDDVKEAKDKASGQKPQVESDDRNLLLEVQVELDLEGFEDRDEQGEPTGIAMPYVVTIEKQSSEVLSIYRNWREDDPRKNKRQHFIHYIYFPGLGFYGFGLIHLVGGLAKTATSILRQLNDAGTLSNLPGGLKARGMRIENDDTPIGPGEWRDVDIPAGTVKDNIVPLPYKEPSTVLYNLLNTVTEEGRRFASVSDAKITDHQQNAPVGTTLALLERSMKVMSAVQARIHASAKDEFRMLAEIVKEHYPPEYPFEVEPGATRTQDYDDRVDVIPVSDPNASTMSQRVVQHQAALQLSQTAPQIYDQKALHRTMLRVLGIEGIDEIIPDEADLGAADPVTENMRILASQPVKALLYQDHEAHVKVHMAAAEDPKIKALVGQSPQANQIAGQMAAHVQEHVGMQYRREIEKQLGVELPHPEEPLPEEVEVQLSKLVADAADRVLKKNQIEQQAQEIVEKQQDPVVQNQEREVGVKEAQVQRQAAADQAKVETSDKDRASREAVELERIASAERAAGAQIGAQVARDVMEQEAAGKELSSREAVAGAQIGAKVADTVSRERVGKEQAKPNRDGDNS